ncbi:MAG: isoprenyl transferase [Candidatus Eisenbacteria bacterium]|uniref:Isoprenyl transferase n=1 Tax=Eiseniibacteriota bacterium TaxID=2212470 RepID=A0A956M0I1_UNCEI|nr:isoprenyl transferase [Candidatus Eisenbacteria bacterium]
MSQSELLVDRENLVARGNLPRHVAIIMDGNGRWATRRGLPRIAGHHAGRRSVREVVEGCGELGIECLTLFTFSSENWSRPSAEVSALMRFLRQVLLEEVQELADNNVRLETIGRRGDLPRQVRRELEKTMTRLAGNTGLRLVLALSYGGRSELVDCCRDLAREVRDGTLDPEKIDEALVERHLYTAGIPNPDLLIRTSGEMRLSNFLLWQLAYAEIYVTDTLWPDFRKGDLFRAISEYQNRDRRFGRIE